MGHGHDHHHGPTPERALWLAIALNAAFLVVEAVVGWWTNSLALLSDAGHMISDVGALTIALVAVRLSHRPPSQAYTFGLRRAPVLGALLNGISLVVIVALITFEAISRLSDPPQLDASLVIATGVAGLVVNLVSAAYLARTRDESVNTRGAMLHLLSDALGSLAAIIAGIAVLVGPFPLADPIASLVIALLILLSSLPLLRDTGRILLQRAPAGIDLAALRAAMVEHRHVAAVNDLHLWALDSGQPVLSAVLLLETDELSAANHLADEVRDRLHSRFGIEHVTLECRHVHTDRKLQSC